MKNDTQLYINVMEEARDRLNFVKLLPARNASTGFQVFDQELVFLQLRKILELVAFASLTANREKYSAARKKFGTFWRAKDMLQDLEKINPDFYPMPIQRPRVQPNGIKHCAAVDGFLTKDDFVSLYDVSGGFLHVRNPFSTQGPVVRMRYNVRQWLERIQALLALHIMRLVDGKVWVVEVPEQVQVKMWLAEPLAGRAPAGVP
jgi:hypothetical protein